MNKIEEYKKEKDGLDILDDIPRYAAEGWEKISDGDKERMKWAGVFFRRQTPGHFMMRLRIPNGFLSAMQLRTISEISGEFGKGFADLTTRQQIQLRWFGLEGLRRRIERHIELAQAFAARVDADPDWERLAPVPFSTVCFRYRPATLAGREADPHVAAQLDELNGRLMDAVNGTGDVFLSHTRLADRFTIRLAVGNLRTEERHVDRAWQLLKKEATRLDA